MFSSPPSCPDSRSSSSGARWLFVHVPKTGGSSVRSALRQRGDAYGGAKLHRGHAGAIEHIAGLGRERWDELTTVALIRDPFARLVSCWSFAFNKEPRRVMDPEAFRQWVAEDCPLPGRFNLWLGPQRDGGRRIWMQAPQVEWLTDESGSLVVSRLFRLEHIAREWGALMAALGAPGVPPVCTNRSEHRAVEDYYDEPTRQSVRERYAVDFGRLGYPAR